jgi:hypothetical protein
LFYLQPIRSGLNPGHDPSKQILPVGYPFSVLHMTNLSRPNEGVKTSIGDDFTVNGYYVFQVGKKSLRLRTGIGYQRASYADE